MSLVCWLPLNGTLENKGISNVTVTNNGATIDSAGKIGNCYAFNGSTGYISLVGTQLFQIFTGGSQQFSIAMWVYHADATRAILFGDYSTSGAINFNIELSTGHGVRFYWNGSPDTYPSNATVAASGWTHVTLTYNGSLLQSYINGVAKGSWSGTLGAKNKTSGEFRLGRDNRSDSTAFNGKMNDFRVYDHCLSAAEVHEISQGLVLHYKLDSFQGGYGNPNLVTGSNTASTSTNKWLGHSAVGGNTSTIVTDENGNICVQVARDSTTQSSWDYLSYDNLIRNQIKTNTTYTVSFDCKPSVNGTIGFTGFVNGNATNYMTSSTSTIQGTCYANQWNHMVYRGVTKASFEDISVSGQVVYFSRSASLRGVNTTVLFKNIKVEEGTSDTPWCPADNELTIDRTYIQDSSGYGRNGTVTGTISLISDTPRYSSSTKFSSGGYITHPQLFTMYYATYSFWVKEPSFTAYGAIYSPTGSPSNGTTPWFSANTEGSSVWAYFGGNSPNYTKVSGSLSTNTWYHCAYVWNNGVAQWYLNGVATGNSVTYTGRTYIQNTTTGSLGDSYTGTSWSGTPFTGQLSDFRIYATALSADDIKQLYNVSAKVDNLGNYHTFEYIDENNVKVLKTGQTKAQHFMEYNSLIPTSITSTSYKPSNNGTNQCSGSATVDLSQFTNSNMAIRLQLDIDITWNNFGFNTPPEGGTARTYLQGDNRQLDGTWKWAGTNYFTGTQFKSYIDANSTGTTHITKQITIPASWFNTYNGSHIMFRTDYSNGNGTIGFSNLKIVPLANSDYRVKVYPKRITARQFIER